MTTLRPPVNGQESRTMLIRPTISDAVFAMRPDYAALSICADGIINHRTTEPVSGHSFHPWAEAHLSAWQDAYRAFGAKPQRTPNSADALRSRVERNGSVPPINAIVDLYNTVSLNHAVPVGGEDALLYQGQPRLIRASGDEPFDTIAAGEPKIEHAEQGEVVWCDELGVTCRRWNWRQGVRTRITEQTTSVWFVLERLEPMPLAALIAAGEELVEGLRRLGPDGSIRQSLIEQSGQTSL